MVPPTALQNAVALLTVAMHATDTDELRALIDEFRAKDDSDELLLATVSLCRSLCFASSKLIHVIDEHLTNDQAEALTEDELFPMALGVVRTYASAAARGAEATGATEAAEATEPPNRPA